MSCEATTHDRPQEDPQDLRCHSRLSTEEQWLKIMMGRRHDRGPVRPDRAGSSGPMRQVRARGSAPGRGRLTPFASPAAAGAMTHSRRLIPRRPGRLGLDQGRGQGRAGQARHSGGSRSCPGSALRGRGRMIITHKVHRRPTGSRRLTAFAGDDKYRTDRKSRIGRPSRRADRERQPSRQLWPRSELAGCVEWCRCRPR